MRAVFSVTLLSRLGGLAREVIVARLFGDTAVGSAFAAAFAIPNLFRRLFGEGALSAAFIPEYTRAVQSAASPPPRGGASGEPSRLASLTLLALGAATGLLTLIAEGVLLALLLLLPHDAERALSLRLVMVMLPFMPFICTVAILAGMLQVHGRFAASATGPLVLNAFIIAFGLFFLLTGRAGGETAALVIGVATVLSGLTQALWFTLLLRRHVRWTLDLRPAFAPARAMLGRFVPVLIGLGTLQLSALIDTAITMYPIWVGPTLLGRAYPLDDASTVILAASQRLYQFPLGVFGIAVATAIFPLLSRTAGTPADFSATLRRGIRLSLFIGLPASIGLLLVRHDLVATLLGSTLSGPTRSGFSAEGVARAAAVLLGYAPAVWAFSLNHVLTRAFYALGDTRSPMRVSLLMVGVNLALNAALIWPLREAGLAWSTSLCATVQCLWLARLLHTRGCAPLDRITLSGAGRIALATVVLVLACLAAGALLPEARTWSAHALRLATLTATGAATYAVAALLLRVPELRWLMRPNRATDR